MFRYAEIVGLSLIISLMLTACGQTSNTATTVDTEVTENEEHEHEEDEIQETGDLGKIYTVEDIDKAISDANYNAMEVREYIDDDKLYYMLLTETDGYMYYEIDTEHYISEDNVTTTSIVHKYNDTEQEVYLYATESEEPYIAEHYILDKSKIEDLVSTEVDLSTITDSYKEVIDSVVQSVKEHRTMCQYKETQLIVHDYYDIVDVMIDDGTYVICYVNIETDVVDAIEYNDAEGFDYVLTNAPIINPDLHEYTDYVESEHENIDEYFKFNYNFVANAYLNTDESVSANYKKELENSNIKIK